MVCVKDAVLLKGVTLSEVAGNEARQSQNKKENKTPTTTIVHILRHFKTIAPSSVIIERSHHTQQKTDISTRVKMT